MLLISTSHRPATDLGFLLHKNPARLHTKALAFGEVQVVFTEATDEKCSALVLLDVDPIGQVRGRSDNVRWDEYVNDRPYVASSYLSAALTAMFSTAMSGRSKERQETADIALPLEFQLSAVRCRGGQEYLRSLFEPLGYTVSAIPIPLDTQFPEWGAGSLFSVTLHCHLRLKDALEHLYVLIPVLDDDKHYWVGKDEVEKLLRRAGTWLKDHPERETITHRYLQRQFGLAKIALARLLAEDGDVNPADAAEQSGEFARTPSLHEQRIEAVAQAIKESGARRVLDLGCGEGRLLRLLLKDTQFTEIVGVDVAVSSLEKAARRLRVEQLSDRQRERIRLVHGSLTYRDRTLEGFDAAALVEVIEHLDEARLGALERVVFEFTKPANVFVTTPNREYNHLFEGMMEGAMRHHDHRFEWDRAEFLEWASGVCERFNYTVEIVPLGPVDDTYGAPTQMAVFRR